MAAVDVLPSENCLRQPHDLRYDAPHQNRHVDPNPNMQSRRRRRLPPPPPVSESKSRKPVTRRVSDRTVSTFASAAKNLVIGQVTILKRGEPLPVIDKIDERPELIRVDDVVRSGVREAEDLVLCSSGRLGPEPEAVRKQILASDFYAGLTSPDPSSLPFPAKAILPPKKEKVDSATTDLLRLLRIDLS